MSRNMNPTSHSLDARHKGAVGADTGGTTLTNEELKTLEAKIKKLESYLADFPDNEACSQIRVSMKNDISATKAKIKSAFMKNLKAKALNKKVLSQFMDLVC